MTIELPTNPTHFTNADRERLAKAATMGRRDRRYGPIEAATCSRHAGHLEHVRWVWLHGEGIENGHAELVEECSGCAQGLRPTPPNRTAIATEFFGAQGPDECSCGRAIDENNPSCCTFESYEDGSADGRTCKTCCRSDHRPHDPDRYYFAVE